MAFYNPLLIPSETAKDRGEASGKRGSETSVHIVPAASFRRWCIGQHADRLHHPDNFEQDFPTGGALAVEPGLHGTAEV